MIASHVTTCDGLLYAVCIGAALAWLEKQRDAINAMNVFPVPDGDTGTNMWHTLHSAYSALDASPITHIGQASDVLARGALRGARGNSGTILSMLLRGFANGLADHDTMDAAQLKVACASAVQYAYDTVTAVMSPVEGTILTVARLAAVGVADEAETDLGRLMERLLHHAQLALAQTPDLLPVLRQAGVVDSGGAGLVALIEGIVRFRQGESLEITQRATMVLPADWQHALEPDDEQGYGYDVQFLMLGTALDVKKVRQELSAMGWSPLIDGDSSLIKVHIHVHNPAEPIGYAIAQGAQLDDIVVENMQRQYLDYVGARQQRESAMTLTDDIAVVTTVTGDGLHALMREYGAAAVIAGGQTMNPSVEDFVHQVSALPNRQVILLPNNGNVVLTAAQVAQFLPERTIMVVPSKTIPQGIAALIAFWNRAEAATLEEVSATMRAALGSVQTLEITTASRDVADRQIRQGEWLGLLNDVPQFSGTDMRDILLRLLHQADTASRELISLYYGADVTAAEAETMHAVVSREFPAQSVELLAGGQPLYPYIVSLE